MQELNTEELIQLAKETGELPIQMRGVLRGLNVKQVHRCGKRLINEYRKQYDYALEDDNQPNYGELFVNEFYLVEKQIKQAYDALDTMRFKRVARFASGKWHGYPRIFALALELLQARFGVLEINSLTAYFDAYQSKNTLTSREIWMLPDVLRFALLYSVEDCIDSRRDDDDKLNLLRNLLLSMREIEDIDWTAALEGISAVERALSRDSVYSAMDTASKRNYADAIERIAKKLKVSETAVAVIAFKLAIGNESASRYSHVGYYLIGRGKSELMSELRPNKQYPFNLSQKQRLSLFICMAALIAFGLAIAIIKENPAAAILAVIPASAIAHAFLLPIYAAVIKPKPLPRLALDFGVGENNRTLVCVPVLITSEKSVCDALVMLESHYLSNRLDNVEFAVLGDFPDADAPELPGEQQLLELARERVSEMNKKYSSGAAPIFHYLHRARVYNKADGLYMGWERKRGAIHALLELLTKSRYSDFNCVFPEFSHEFKFLVTLDADTVAPNGTLKKLIGAAAHPLNTPVFSSSSEKPTDGYTIIAPRMAVTSRSAAKTLFANLVSGDSGMSAYSICVSDFYQDTFEEGIFGGKGIINIEAFVTTLDGMIPDNTVLSHDLLEGCFSRAALADDIVLYDSEPSNIRAWFKRRHRWIRGDWQLTPYLFGKLGKTLDGLSKYKIFDNLRRSFENIAALAAISAAAIFGWRGLMGIGLAAFFIDPIVSIVVSLIRLIREKVSIKPIVLLIRRRIMEFILLPYAALRDADAITRVIYRMLVSHKHMLEWQTAADSCSKQDGTLGGYYKTLLPCVVCGIAYEALAIGGMFGILPALIVMPIIIGAIWLLSPCLGRRFDAQRRSYTPSDNARIELMQLFGCTWRYFETQCNLDTSFLPPDNLQESPRKPVVAITSPTNIGMGFMAVVSAYDMGVISANEMYSRLSNMLASIEKMEKWNGHLFNWYRLSDLSLLKPRFISTVDSGNFAACLMVASAALKELGTPEGEALADRCDKLVEAIDFTVLYDKKRKLFHIGCEFDEGRLSHSWYDLLASEARLTSFIAIARGQIGIEHWSALSRLMTDASGGRTLKSWSGTMFEYLMPLLFLETVPHSLQYEACRNAVLTQIIENDTEHPWGVSESGYYAFDRELYYQYRAFGIAGLGLAPHREKSDVIAPYATMLALMIEPERALKNISLLKSNGAMGKYGMYEAIDYTPERIGESRYEIVKSYMAHHQGMSLCAINNIANDNVLVKRFMSIPCVRANELLLFENMPSNPITISAYESSIFRDNGKARRIEPGYRIIDTSTCLDGQLLSNGRYSCYVLSDMRGYSKCRGIMLNRFRAGRANEQGIDFLMSDGVQAWRCDDAVVMEPHKVTFEDEHDSIKSRLSVMVSADFDCEIRTLTLINGGNEPKSVSVGCFCEVALAGYSEDESHPAFVKITIDSEEEEDSVLFVSRAKPDRPERWAFFSLVSPERPHYCTDGLVLPGRNKSHSEAMLSYASEYPTKMPVEPYFFARTEALLSPGQSENISLIAGIAATRSECLNVIREQRLRINRLEEVSRAQAVGMLRQFGISCQRSIHMESLAARIVLREPYRTCSGVEFGRIEQLWSWGISGDLPIITMRISKPVQLRGLRSVLTMSLYMREKGLEYDLVVIGEYPHEYGNRLRNRIEEMMVSIPNAHLIHAYDLNEAEERFITSIALITLDADAPFELPPLLPEKALKAKGPLEYDALEHMQLDMFNGYGGFSDGNDEYVIYVKNGRNTPLPWSNVLANDSFGSLVTEYGGGYTWKDNAQLNRITVWTNDVIHSEKSERILVRDAQSGAVWDLTPNDDCEYEIRHGFGYTVFRSRIEGIEAVLTEAVDSTKPIKYFNVKMINNGFRRRNLNISAQAAWVLGTHPRAERLLSESRRYGIFVRNVLKSSDRPNETAFLALADSGNAVLLNTFAKGITVSVVLEPVSEATFTILLGEAEEEKIEEYVRECDFDAAMKGVHDFWKNKLDRLHVHTEDDSLDMIINRRLLYQTYASRLMGRTGFYQSGGATGFRDQLQDVLALLLTDEKRARNQILECASKQFEEGDVLHWWHDDCRGVRTKITDDRLFLPFVAAAYAKASGDYGIFDEECRYLADIKIPEGAANIYCRMEPGGSGTLYEHCLRAFECSMKLGTHGLPLMGSGDWNDSMDCVGEGGGESVWLGWFMLVTLEQFADICEARSDGLQKERLLSFAADLRKSIESCAWDGAWYRRAFFGDGSALGSSANAQCAIDCISECWAVFANAEHKETAFNSLLSKLVDSKSGVIKLLTPPFSNPVGKRVGYIEAYLDGVRENGGQYTHAAAWCVIAACMLGDAETAQRLIKLINPVEHGRMLEIDRYKAEPYVVAGDVYSEGRIAGRAGWSWYTGAAGWMYQAAVNYILGISKRDGKLHVSPCTIMHGFSADYIIGEDAGTLYRIRAERTGRRIMKLDGHECEAIALIDDGRVHEVEVEYC